MADPREHQPANATDDTPDRRRETARKLLTLLTQDLLVVPRLWTLVLGLPMYDPALLFQQVRARMDAEVLDAIVVDALATHLSLLELRFLVEFNVARGLATAAGQPWTPTLAPEHRSAIAAAADKFMRVAMLVIEPAVAAEIRRALIMELRLLDRG